MSRRRPKGLPTSTRLQRDYDGTGWRGKQQADGPTSLFGLRFQLRPNRSSYAVAGRGQMTYDRRQRAADRRQLPQGV
jgi:hypothetical protein